MVLALMFGGLPAVSASAKGITEKGDLALDNAAWQYDGVNDVYYQLSIDYSSSPESADYEQLNIYVPGKYMVASPNSGGKYTVHSFTDVVVNGFTADTAPIMLPMDTSGHRANLPRPTYLYADASNFVSKGLIYVDIGVRGKGASDEDLVNVAFPWAVSDFKAGVRYLRLNDDVLPGSTELMFTYGTSGGGNHAGTAGASGNAPGFLPYLHRIGAAGVTVKAKNKKQEFVSTIRDDIAGTMQWVPIADHQFGNESYEWGLGQFLTNATTDPSGMRYGNTFTAPFSDDLAAYYPRILNSLGLKDPKGNKLRLEKSAEGIYAAGSYYDFLKRVIEKSLNNFLADSTDAQGSFSFKTFTSPEAYIASITGSNSKTGTNWIYYDSATNTAKITSVGEFVANLKGGNAKDVTASDSFFNTSTNYSTLDEPSLHFDLYTLAVLGQNETKYASYHDWNPDYITAFRTQPYVTDEVGTTTVERSVISSQSNYINPNLPGYGTSDVSPYWRINSGAFQSDVPITTEMNLYLQLEQMRQKGRIRDVQFTTVWEKAHTSAERVGTSTDNLIAWVIESSKDQLRKGHDNHGHHNGHDRNGHDDHGDRKGNDK